jgi:benzoyl-CoA reductase/2-hydroxyglutaryl-CoA dehydratase subunit BcrC/BadD/HgdB
MTEKRIGYTSPYLPPEIIWACGMTPVRLRPGDSLASADGYLSRNFSIEVRALLATALEGGFGIEAVIFLDEDDTSRRLYDVWRAYADIPTLNLVPLPRLDTHLAHDRYGHAFTELADELAALSGRPLTTLSLDQAITVYNEQRGLLCALRQRWIDGYLSSTDWHDLRWSVLTNDPIRANAELTTNLQSTSNHLTSKQAGPRLLILGGMIVPRPFLTFLETCGARVVAEDSESDERTLTQTVSLSSHSVLSTMLENLAAAYLAKPPGPRPAALSRRLATIAGLLDERNVQGVIAMYPKFADAYLAEYMTLAELFDSRGVSSLLLEDDGESGFTGQQRTRVEAFLEVIA